MDAYDADAGAPHGSRDHPTNLSGLVTSAAHARPEDSALVDERRRLTWAMLEAECAGVARGLTGLGVVAGHRVAILLANRIEFVTVYLGSLRAGLVAVPLNPSSATGEIVRVLADCAARVVVCDSATVTAARAAVAGLADALEGADDDLRARAVVPRLVVVDSPALPDEHSYAELDTAAAEAPSPQDPETLAVLLYTSGTSGRPRAAMLTHRALLANIDQAAALTPPPMDASDRVLGVLPLFHVYGLNAVLGQVLRQGATLVITERFHTEETLALIAAEAVTNVPVAPPVLIGWAHREDLAERLRGVRTVLCGASPLAAEVARRFETGSGLTVHQGYGLTEAAPAVTSTLGSTGGGTRPKPGSVGRPLPGVELRIVDDSGRDADEQDPGEIWVRGDNLFSGYWPDGDGRPGDQGWYATGDVGYVDGDGDLFLVDRLKEIVIVSGFNVYPVEIEDVITELDAVAEAAVIGAGASAGAEAVVAYVVADPRSGASTERLADDVRAHCAERLARFKWPSDVRVVDELPHSVTGKVAKGRLRELERRRTLGLA